MDTTPFSWFNTGQERIEAVRDVHTLTPSAKKLLREVTEHTKLVDKRISESIQALESAGFVSVSEPDYWSKRVTVTATLWGEEAIELYDTQHKNTK